MNALEVLAGLNWWAIAGWTMLHYLWLGLMVGAAAGVLRFALRRASANARYAAAVVCLAALAVLPVGVGVWVAGVGSQEPGARKTGGDRIVDAGASPQAVVEAGRDEARVEGVGAVSSAKPRAVEEAVEIVRAPEMARGVAPAPVDVAPIGVRPLADWGAAVDVAASWLPWVWIVGAPVTFLLLATGVVGAERLRRESRLVNDGPVMECLERLRTSLRIGRRVAVAVCERVATPVLVGVVRPLVLLPPAALTGWSPDEIEMVLLHELAHVRRWDNLVNLVQRFVEAALFFQPAVWLVSGWVRREREACCDAVVVRATQRPQAYAELLVALAAQLPRSVLFHPAAASAMAAGPLRGRIRRILGIHDDPILISGKSLGVVMSGLLLAATLVVLNLSTSGKAEEAETEKSGSTVGVADALEAYRQVVVGYDLDFDSVFPDRPWTKYEAKRLLRYPTPQAWPDVLGNVDADTGEFREIHERPEGNFLEATGGNAFLVPLAWSVGTKDYATLLFLKGIEADAHVVAHSYTSFANFGPMAGDVLFKSYATALVDGELTGQITADSYFNLVVTGKFTGRIQTGSYAMVYLMSGLAGDMKLKHSKVYIAGRTERKALGWIRGAGKVFLEESDLAAGEHQIGELAVTVKSGTAERLTTGDYTQSLREVDGDFVQREYSLSSAEEQRFQAWLSSTRNNDEKYVVLHSGSSPGQFKIDATQATHDELRRVLAGRNHTHAKFPTLEEQKLADEIWRRTNGLELEPLDAESLKKVKALGYEGGLRNTNGSSNLQSGDILVGLHVWPTTSLQDVVDVLNREDIAELTPLKYYVVRERQYGGANVDTGRIEVASKQKDPTPAPVRESTDAKLPAPTIPNAVAATNAGASVVPNTEPTPSTQPGLNRRNVLTVERLPFVPLSEAEKAELVQHGPLRLEFYYSPDSEPCKRAEQLIEDYQRAFPKLFEVERINVLEKSATATQKQVRHLPTMMFYQGKHRIKLDVGAMDLEQLTEFITRFARGQQQVGTEPIPKRTPRYDGKSFYEWRDAWQTELSTAKRIEAVKALAAFGRAGYGKEAAAVILDVAGEYDFTFMQQDNDADGKLKQAVIEVLSPESGRPSLAEFWLPDLVVRMKDDPGKWQPLLVYAVGQLRTDNPQVIGLLRTLAEQGPAEVRGGALGALVRSERISDRTGTLSEETRKLLAAALTSDDLDQRRSALWLLVYDPNNPWALGWNGMGDARLFYLPEIVGPLLGADEELRQRARLQLQYVQAKDAPELVEQLLKVLKDESRAAEHVEAIRAIAAMGPAGAAATEELKKVVFEGKDENAIIAAVLAVACINDKEVAAKLNQGGLMTRSITPSFVGAIQVDNERVNELNNKLSEIDRFSPRLEEEAKVIFPESRPRQGGGMF